VDLQTLRFAPRLQTTKPGRYKPIKNMKKTILILILMLAQTASAEILPYSEFIKFSEWSNKEKFSKYIEQIASNQYPVVIEAGALVGDGVVYRVLVNNKPENKLKYEYVYGVNENKYLEQTNLFNKDGYVLIHHQILQGMAHELHQAIWVKAGL
jgi:hypothetical protein